MIFIFGAALAYLLLFRILFAPDIVKNIPTIIFDNFPLVDVLILGGAFIFSVEGMCALVARFFKREISFIRATTMYPVPAFILSGYTFPNESMGAAPKLFPDALILILIGAICFVLAIKKPPKTFERQEFFKPSSLSEQS